MMLRLLFCLTLLGVIHIQLVAHSIKGLVVNENDTPIEDVQVNILGKNRHTHTNLNGIFELKDIEWGDTLIVTHLSFKMQRIPIQNVQRELLIRMEASIFNLEDVVISPDVDALNVIAQIDLATAPVKSAQEVLQRVPGLIIGQHAGGGKAEQIFLRGFDIDHGTDVSITVDGLPVNMVSHAHGQGYADLHFLIPETIEEIDFGKGPYYANQGNFATAGYVDFKTKDRLDQSSIGLEIGQFNRIRTVGMFDLLNTPSQNAYIASAYLLSDGFFESPQNLNRFNLLGKYTAKLNDHDRLSILASYFNSKWDASGQIPQRAVDAGLISRFGAIDDTEGGSTGRTNLKLDYTKFLSHTSSITNSVYFTQYDFELYSNFTFFLDDPINGDQIRQRENRDIFGVSSVWNNSFTDQDYLLQVGVGFRNDQTKDSELSRTLNRTTTLDSIQLGDINESNLYSFVHAEFVFGKWLINPGLRLDYFNSEYNDHLLEGYQTQAVTQTLLSPKLNFLYNHSSEIQTYLKLGSGFHSNDARVVVAQGGQDILPVAYGADLGVIWKPTSRLFFNAAAWYLFLEQEFVYVGDAGIVEPSGRTRRLGLDIGARYQLTDWLFADVDVNLAQGRSIDDPEGANYIPLAPSLTSSGGFSVNTAKDWSGSLRYRYVGDRPANEDNSIVADGYFIIDANVNYTFKNITLGITIENLLDQAWNETQFATESRLFDEINAVEEIHFTPGTPFFMRGKVTYNF